MYLFCSKSYKNRKKSQRKKVSLKEGSQYEDLALMEALAEIISFVDKMQGRILSFRQAFFWVTFYFTIPT
jgi:hypothetical protein